MTIYIGIFITLFQTWIPKIYLNEGIYRDNYYTYTSESKMHCINKKIIQEYFLHADKGNLN